MKFSQIYLAFFLSFIFFANPTKAVTTIDTIPAPIIFHGGHIYTVQESAQTAEAMLIQGKRIIGLGTLAEMHQLAKDNNQKTIEHNLKGKTLLPGFIDSHVHVRELGMDAIKADLVGTTTTKEMVARLKAFFPNPRKGEWLIGQGWDEGAFASRGYPDRTALDRAFPHNPIQLESLHGFAGFYNGKALEIAGITNSTPNPKVGQILRRTDGTATGVMLTLAQALVNDHVPAPTGDQLQKAIIAGLNIMANKGVTSIHEAGMTAKDVKAFLALSKSNKLPIRVYGMLYGNDKDLMRKWYKRGYLSDPSKMLEIRGVKVFYDGSLGSRTAMLAAPYSDHPDKANPTERISPAEMTWLADQAAKHDFQMAVHAIGDEGNNRTLKIYENALRPTPQADHRWRVEHAQVVLPDFYNRAGKLGLVASMQSSHAVGDSGWAEDRVGPARIKHAYAWQKMLKAGVHLALNSDLPGEPWTPMETLFFAVNRTKLDDKPKGGWYSNEALTVQQAIKAMTIENAYAAYQDQHIGSLAAGKFADFVILDQDPFNIDPKMIHKIKVLSTWVNGRLHISP